MNDRSCIILGASGLIGGHLLGLLAADPKIPEVRALVRRPLGISLDSKVREIVIDYDDPASYRDHLAVDDVFCCLGTTMKRAGSKEAFRKVDFEAPIAIARASRAAGATQYLIVTAVGANPKSGVFYNKVKGETEAALGALDFPRGLKIFHPSMLLGERTESRPLERVAAIVMRATRPIFAGGLEKYRAIDAVNVARAMHIASSRESQGTSIFEGQSLFALVD